MTFFREILTQFAFRRGYYSFYLPASHTITLTSTDPCLSILGSDFLRLHTIVRRVADLSGAAGCLDLEARKIVNLEVLGHDGSSADLPASHFATYVAFMT